MACKTLDHDDYTVGWVCALPKELIAARAMLDETHADLPRSYSDRNVYTLGRVGRHNVVIASLPKGDIGNNSSAIVATRMTSTFPSIKFGLMVGIGGGVPKNVRLGDVVVSTPTDGYGGVVQWDLGKTEKNETFKQTGALNRPPTELLAALAKLETEHAMKGSRIPQYLDELRISWPKLIPKYIRSKSLKDILFRADCIHVAAPADRFCENEMEQDDEELNETEQCMHCDQSKIIHRKPREMQVHYGLIASGNQVIKDAVFRDKINERLGGNVLCFEMEAAGLLNDFPCIVIRGICDYADSHKNKTWQEHAAAVAAAFGKELLSVVPTKEVEQMPTINSICDDLKGLSASVDQIVSNQRTQDYQVALDWLTQVDYTSEQHDFISRRQEGTGQWFLDSAEFKAWLEENHQNTLFCPGKPGAGKTIIAAIVIDYLHKRFQDDESIGIAYIYCNFRRQDEQRADRLLTNILKQLARSRPAIVQDLYDRHKRNNTRPHLSEMVETLGSLATSYSRVFIIIDALDECLTHYDSRTSEMDRAKFLKKLFALQAKAPVKLLVTSRENGDVASFFHGTLRREISATDGDILAYLNEQLSLCQAEIIDDSTRKIIRGGVLKSANGMFLLVALHANTLLTQPTKGHLKEALQGLGKGPDGLDRAYDQAMERVQCQATNSRDLAMRILGWLVHAKRPLSALELRHALAVRRYDKRLNEDYLPAATCLQSVCAGLVTIDEESGIIRLVHYTTQEYFRRTQHRWFPNANKDMTVACLTYLSFTVFGSGFCRSDEEFEQRMQLNPFYSYATRNWGYHAQQVSPLPQEVIGFLEQPANMESATQAVRVKRWPRRLFKRSDKFPRDMTGLHMAAAFGVVEAAQILIGKGLELDAKDSDGQTPLMYAAQQGHTNIVEQLLAQPTSTDTNSTGYASLTALSIAAKRGHEAIVGQLLAKPGIDIESRPHSGIHRGQTALSIAAQYGHAAVVKQFLEKNADLETMNAANQTPLWFAADGGHVAAVKMLLEKGAAVEGLNFAPPSVVPFSIVACQEYPLTPLAQAAFRGHEAVVRVLLENHADPNYSQGRYWRRENHFHERYWRWETPFPSLVAHEVHAELTRILLEYGAEVNDMISGMPTLTRAEERRYEAAVELVPTYPDVLVDGICRWPFLNPPRDMLGRSALSIAAEMGHVAIVEMLLAHPDVDVNSSVLSGRTALSFAAEHGNTHIVKLLLKQCARTDIKDRHGRTALWYSCEGLLATRCS